MTKKKILPITLGMMLLGVGSSAARVHESYVPAPRHEHPEEIQAPRGEHPEEIQAPRGEHPEEIQAPRGVHTPS